MLIKDLRTSIGCKLASCLEPSEVPPVVVFRDHAAFGSSVVVRVPMTTIDRFPTRSVDVETQGGGGLW